MRKARQVALTSKKSQNSTSNGKRKNQGGEGSGRSGKKPKTSCKHCGKSGHKSDDCWTLEKNANKQPKNYRVKKNGNGMPKLTQEQLNLLMESLYKISPGELGKRKKNRKRQVQWTDQDEEENKKANAAEDTFLTNLQKQLENSRINDDSSDEDSESYMLFHNSTLEMYPFNSVQLPKKKQKVTHYSAEILVEIQDRNGEYVPIRALLDTGTSATLLLCNFVARGRAKGYKHQPTKWSTLGSSFVTNRKALVDFKFPKLSSSKTITWIIHVDHKTT
jgi:hypothetical protein